MLKTIFIFLFSILTVNFSQAQEISADQLTLMGTPVENRATGEKIALACTELGTTGDQCKKLQFVIFKDQSATFFGREMIVQNPEDLKGELKKTYKKIRKILKSEYKSYWGATAGMLLVLVGVSGVIVALVAIAAPMEFVILAGIGLVVGGSYADIYRYSLDFNAGIQSTLSGKKLEATRTQEGWNWSVRSKKVSSKKFRRYLNSIDLMLTSYTPLQ